MKQGKLNAYLILIIIQSAFLFIAFPLFIKNGFDGMFCISFDGMKNYFTLDSYVKEPTAGSALAYHSMAYPFGDYIYFTDNTPLFAFLYKQLGCNKSLAIPAFNAMVLLNILVCSLLTFKLFSKIIADNRVVLLLAIVLPWTNIQTSRILAGHFNLSLSFIVVLAILLLYELLEKWSNALRRNVATLGLILLIAISFFIHGYYVAILAVFIGSTLMYKAVVEAVTKKSFNSFLYTLAIPALGVGVPYSIVRLTDGYYKLRKAGAMDYDHANMKSNFFMFFTHYDFHTLGFPLASTMESNIETKIYLGNIGLLCFSVLWLGAVLNRQFRSHFFSIQKSFFRHAVLAPVFWGSFICLMVSFGEQYGTNRDPLVFFSPFKSFNALAPEKQVLMVVSALAMLLVGAFMFSPSFKRFIQKTIADYKTRTKRKLAQILVIGLMVFLFIGRYAAEFPNILNPFLYLHFVTPMVEQFRNLSRFSWPFFWTYYIWLFFVLNELKKVYSLRTYTIGFVAISIVGLWEVVDLTNYMSKYGYFENVLSAKNTRRDITAPIDYSHYQAILPIPYYIVGSEDYDHTIDENNDWSRQNMQLATLSHLPLMSVKLSRTPPDFSIKMLNWLGKGIADTSITQRLNARPVLVVVNNKLLASPNEAGLRTGGRQESMVWYNATAAFVQRFKPRLIGTYGDESYYEWQPTSSPLTLK